MSQRLTNTEELCTIDFKKAWEQRNWEDPGMPRPLKYARGQSPGYILTFGKKEENKKQIRGKHLQAIAEGKGRLQV